MSVLKSVKYGKFEWDKNKEIQNIRLHRLSFSMAIDAFLDPLRQIAIDEKHSESEERYFCIGLVDNQIATVRFTYRGRIVRIIGAGYWRKGKELYEKKRKKN